METLVWVDLEWRSKQTNKLVWAFNLKDLLEDVDAVERLKPREENQTLD